MAKKLKLDHLMDKINNLFKDKQKEMLESVILKGKGPHFCYSITERKFINIQSGAELYLVPDKEDEKGNLYVFSPWTWGSGMVFLIPKEKIIKIGLN